MKKLISSMFVLFCVLAILTGCKSANDAEVTPQQSSLNTVAAIGSDQRQQTILSLTEDKTQLQANIEQQKQTIEQLTNKVADLKKESGALDDLIRAQPWLQLFSHPGLVIKSVEVSFYPDLEGSVTVTDPALLNAFSSEMFITRELFELNPGGNYDSDILPCHYQVKLDDGKTYGITVPARGVLTFDQLAKHDFETHQYIHQLCKALVKKPAFVPDLPPFAKMADSGLLMENDGVYLFSENRIQRLIYAILGANKIEMKVPANAGETIEQYTFYSFGEKTMVTLYEQNIKINDRGKETWFKIDKDALLQIRSVLSAG